MDNNESQRVKRKSLFVAVHRMLHEWVSQKNMKEGIANPATTAPDSDDYEHHISNKKVLERVID